MNFPLVELGTDTPIGCHFKEYHSNNRIANNSIVKSNHNLA